LSEILEVKTKKELDELLEENEKVVVKFSATWCGPCSRLAPHFNAAAERSDATFVHVDVDEADVDLLKEFSIQGVPTVLGFKNGQLAGTVKARTAVPLLREVEEL
jgi:thioredoxin 1